VTIDERLEQLTARHEALIQTVDLMLQEHRDLVRKHTDFVSRMTQYSADVKDAIARLANIAAAHDDAIDDHLEG
jgi:hypothetical protein